MTRADVFRSIELFCNHARRHSHLNDSSPDVLYPILICICAIYKFHQGLIDIHDRRPLVFDTDAALSWINGGTRPEDAVRLAEEHALPESAFSWHPVSVKIGNPRNEGDFFDKKTVQPLL